MVPVPTGIRPYRRLLRYGREGNTGGSLRLQVSQAAVREGSRAGETREWTLSTGAGE